MLLAMLTGMILGMGVLLVVMMLFTGISTLFELFPAGMVITMITGMFAGMVLAAMEVKMVQLLLPAIGFSFFIQIVMELYNLKLSGDVPLE
jgi:hypothetical protein